MSKIIVKNIGEVTIRRSAKARRLILSIKHDGTPQVTVPVGIPMILAKRFVIAHQNWIKTNSKSSLEQQDFCDGEHIGSKHRLIIKRGEKITSRVSTDSITVTVPNDLTSASRAVQDEITKAAARAMRREAEEKLPSRLYELAQSLGYSYNEVRCKSLKTRWGSCSSNKVINLNIWLMQLPGHLIDYVLIHELAHLKFPHHQKTFWQEVARSVPSYKQLRKELKQYRPALMHPSELS